MTIEEELDEVVRLHQKYGYQAAKNAVEAEGIGKLAVKKQRYLVRRIEVELGNAYDHGARDGSINEETRRQNAVSASGATDPD